MLKFLSQRHFALAASLALTVLLLSSCGGSRRSSTGIQAKNAECREFLSWYGKVTSWQQPSPTDAAAGNVANDLAATQEQWAKELEAIESSDSTFVDLKNRLVKQQRDFATLQRQQAAAIESKDAAEQTRIKSVMEASVATVNQSVGEILRYCNR